MFVKIDRVNFELGEGNVLTATKAQQTLSQARKRRRKLRKALKLASSSAARNSAQHAYIASQRVRLAAIIDAAKRIPTHERPSFIECLQWSQSLKLHEPIPEEAWLRLKAKPAGGHRYYLDFGICHTAAQRMVADMLRPQFKHKPYQFGARRSGGVTKAIRHARALIEDGFVHIRRLDIKNFFDSFSHAEMLTTAFPITTKVTEHVVIGGHFNVQIDPSVLNGPKGNTAKQYMQYVGHAGIPQGSAVSPLIGDFFMSKLGVKMPAGARFINYVDDFLVVSKTEAALNKAENALKSAVAGLPVGDFELPEKSGSSFSSSGTAFEFLGHVFHVAPDGHVTVNVSDANVHKAQKEIAERSAKLANELQKYDGHLAHKQIAFDGLVGIACYLLSWSRAFSAADNAEELSKELEAGIMHACGDYPLLKFEAVMAKAKTMPRFEFEPY